jgi:hypothetical protein
MESILTPSKMTSHRDLYKSPSSSFKDTSNDSNNSGAPSWRSAYKKRCFDEFKKSRRTLINKFRNCQVN